MSGNAPVPPPPPPPDRSGDGAGNRAQWQLGGQRQPAWLPQAQRPQVPQAQASQQPQGQAYPPPYQPPAQPPVQQPVQQGGTLPPQGPPLQISQPQGEPHQRRPQPGRRKLGAGWIVFIIVDVLAVLAVVAVAFSVRRPADSPSDAGASGQPGVGTPSAGAESSAPAAVVAQFAAPSGNITCEITSDAATCGIARSPRKQAGAG